jgi:ABC-type Zn uptake system ZnuABC Zn-binding protein ZnuA
MMSKSQRSFIVLVAALVVLSQIDAQAARQQERTRAGRGWTTPDAGGRTRPLHVVTTLPDYAALAKIIGGDRITVESIVHPIQDPHHIRPKPSFVHMATRADVMISTGLDLELWLPTVVNTAGNARIRSGEIGYVAVAQGLELIEKPQVISQAEGDVHIYGNPHIMTSPINARHVARNIAIGLIRNDPQGKEFYEENLKTLQNRLDESLFGAELVKLLGGETLCKLTSEHRLIGFLQENKYQGEPLIDRLGGWMKKMLPLRGTAVVVYHKDWSYLLDLFGLEEAGDVEPKPGIPPSPKHVTKLIEMMQDRHIRIFIAANYFDQQQVKMIAERTGAEAVVSALFVGGAEGTDDYFKLVDHWVSNLVAAGEKTGLIVK